MIEPKEIIVDDKTYVISKFPAVEGRELAFKYYAANDKERPLDYVLSEEVMFKMLAYVAIILPTGDKLKLTTKALINNHIPNWATCRKLEDALVDYNFSFS